MSGNTKFWRSLIGRIKFSKSNYEAYHPPVFEAFKGAGPRAPTTQALSVLGVDMLVADNNNAHNTSRYKNTNLIVRRNKEFFIIISFDQPFNEQQDNVQLEFMIGSSPDENNGTHIIESIGQGRRNGRWKGRVVETQDNDVTVGITPDAGCIIGRFSTFVTVITNVGKQRTPKNPDTDFYVLFNPWDPADVVYMPGDSDRQEYVMNDVGIIYNGEFNNIAPRSWNYGQFEEGILDACLFILDAGKVPLLYRGNAIELVRQGSALMNSQDDDGVLVGNWSDDYSIGTAPTAWTGSPEILLKYAKDNGLPVCFAQCWVYAGVLNTFLRCLGMPSRVITNYSSAHDNSGNLKTDLVLDEDGTINRSLSRDSVWNYHSWNEVYMRRPDLPEKYSGWQVVDGTPQETSDGLYRCGPTSVIAIKEGELSYPFDARFVFAEVNSDVVYYKSDKLGNKNIISVDTTSVGKLILTKGVNSNNYEDITSTYKYPEGSDMDKRAMQMAENRGVPARDYTPPAKTGVEIELQTDTINIGENFKLTLNIKNQTGQNCTLDVTITGCVVYYTGVTSSIFKIESKTASVDPWKTTQVMFDVTASEYMPYRVEQSNLLFVAYGRIQETGTSLTTTRVVALRPPELTIKVTGTPQVGRDFMVIVSFRNPFNFVLKNIQLRLESPGLIMTKMKTYDQIAPGGTVQFTNTITPWSSGKKVLIACLDCPTVRQVTSQLEIIVQ
ncbi:coagulation factor XIII A chain-like [Carassius auratus]|uniref:protein-glutamine gamma-glutamyltransferase n=1 Tax=Carassius auratus TaxID=7957 RepID=A0A6P6JAX4_CARAU|nr:coagulation factor XIII A chain-like [Carassius auratus]